MSLMELTEDIRRFRDERDWAQFHTPRNLAAAVSVEAAELQESLLWKSDHEVEDFLTNVAGKDAVEQELADVLIYTLLLFDYLEIDPNVAVRRKIALNAKKYPVDQSRGKAVKYTDLAEHRPDDLPLGQELPRADPDTTNGPS